MSELEEYRIRMLERLEEAARVFQAECLAVEDPYAAVEGGWNVHQIAVHTRDVDRLIYGLRARRTALEDQPEFQSFDGDAYMAKNYDASEALEDLLIGFVEDVEAPATPRLVTPIESCNSGQGSDAAILGRKRPGSYRRTFESGQRAEPEVNG
jgi:hypothetical protein